MFRAFLGGLTTGRLARLPFLGFWLLLWVLFMLFGLGLAFGIGLAEPLIFDDLATAQGYLLEHIAPALLVGFALFCLLFVFAQFNLAAKRIRDMGLPGWSVLLLVALASAGLGYVLPPSLELMRLENQVNGVFNGILVLALLFIPGGFFARRDRPAPTAVASAGPDQAGDSVHHREGHGEGPGEGEPDRDGPHQRVTGTAIDPAADQAVEQEEGQDRRDDDDQKEELAEIQGHRPQQ